MHHTARQAPVELDVSELKQMGIDAQKNNCPAKAIALYQSYLARHVNDASIWSNLGVAFRNQACYQQAVICYKRAALVAPTDAGVWSNLGNALKDLDRFEESIESHQKAVKYASQNAQFRLNFAAALREAKCFDEAIEQLELAFEFGADYHKVRWEKALCYLYKGNFNAGWAAYESRWQTDQLPARSETISVWQGESLEAKHILLFAEQGFGDTILAARYITLVKALGARITLECKDSLHRLFSALPLDHLVEAETDVNLATSAPGAEGFAADSNKDLSGQSYDFQCGLMSLPRLFRTTSSTIPMPAVLNIPRSSQEKFSFIKTRYPHSVNIGIVWSGSTTFADNRRRSVGLERFLPFAEIPGIQLFSLQKGPCEKDLSQNLIAPCITNLAPLLEDFADTAAAIEALDLVVMTDSSVAHLAGSLNKPILNLLQFKPYWLYMPETDTSAWYPSMHIIRQSRAGEWQPVFEQASSYLYSFVQNLRN
jgi:tetratricopeptide (TPR) repeat protein